MTAIALKNENRWLFASKHSRQRPDMTGKPVADERLLGGEWGQWAGVRFAWHLETVDQACKDQDREQTQPKGEISPAVPLRRRQIDARRDHTTFRDTPLGGTGCYTLNGD